MLRQRLLFGAMMIGVLVGLIYADDRLSHAQLDIKLLGLRGQPNDGFLVVLVVSVLLFMGGGELYRLCTLANSRPLYRWPVLSILALAWTPYLGFTAWESTIIVLILAFLGCAIGIASRRETHGAANDLSTSFFMIVYLGLLGQFLIRLRIVGPSGAAWLLLYYLAVVKFCDIGAFFTGRALGRHKLIEWLSPKKTIEGLLGGVAASMLAAWAIPEVVARISPSSSLLPAFPRGAYALIFGLAMALLGQAGDLLESLIKRDAESKDAAAKVPAFGGILDILDSVLLTAPAAYWMLR